MAYNSPYTGAQVDGVIANAKDGTNYTKGKTPSSGETPPTNACVTYGYLNSLLPLQPNNGGVGANSNGTKVHPLGYIFEWSNVRANGVAISGAPSLTTATAVHNYFGYGTWELFGVGRVTVGINTSDADFDTIGETGGAKGAWTHAHDSVSLTGSISNMAAQEEDVGVDASGICSAYKAGSVVRYPSNKGGKKDSVTINATHSHPSAGSTNNQLDADKANLQPYIVVYRWIRTA